MRKFLFRGKRVDNGEWVYGHYFNMKHDDERKHIHPFIIPENTPIPKNKPIIKIQVEISAKRLGQYTGLKDKNGVEIYEGDILGMSEEYGGSSYFPLVVEAGYARYQCYSVNNNSNKIPFTNISVGYYEVIGNIYDNPELLEKG